MKTRLTRADEKLVDELVAHFEDSRTQFKQFLEQLFSVFSNSNALASQVHSMKWRVKDPTHLRDKLVRKLVEARAHDRGFAVNKSNLFYKINDLAGFRIIHLYSHQMDRINRALLELFDEERLRLIEGPLARTWDDESRSYFQGIGIKTRQSPEMYTSVHYVIEANRRTRITCELQVRTLMEEVWGEVDHTLNYPHPSTSLTCREQIKVLARLTSSCSRLVDSIFRAHEADQGK